MSGPSVGGATAGHVGVDFGTSNCLVALMRDGQPDAVTLEDGEPTLPSLLYVPRTPRARRPGEPESRALDEMQNQTLQQALAAGAVPAFGRHAQRSSLEDPEGFFFRSPKSFLAAKIDLTFRTRFERIVELMLAFLRDRASEAAGRDIRRACIGRPVHFGGGASQDRIDGDAQAIALVEAAAKRAGFTDVVFEFEPVAAAFDFERQLDAERIALVVDVGGGTTDCTMARLGPRSAAKPRRDDDILASSGERVGGNDVDTALSFNGFMPLMGRRDHDRDGLPMPAVLFADAADFFSVPAQQSFFAAGPRIERLMRASDATVADRLARLLTLCETRQTPWLTMCAEQAKVALAQTAQARVDLDRIEAGLEVALSTEQLADASRALITKLRRLMDEAVAGAGTPPQVIYLTGGSARSPLVRAAISEAFPQVPLVAGDAYGSVVAGLALQAQRVFGADPAR